jgi:hypothetical protein
MPSRQGGAGEERREAKVMKEGRIGKEAGLDREKRWRRRQFESAALGRSLLALNELSNLSQLFLMGII